MRYSESSCMNITNPMLGPPDASAKERPVTAACLMVCSHATQETHGYPPDTMRCLHRTAEAPLASVA
ncbi:hypothetical protein HaLaN_07995 [Haematococcus lacustris]|uniref:Uncharacterized protein n=1 Tax=Haematococcus lacustris TaxID=44745 RepID=A0A699Z003_HAELA|nr:hypothetical protein HaLaN_07995 [Haematococcus lacustris]